MNVNNYSYRLEPQVFKGTALGLAVYTKSCTESHVSTVNSITVENAWANTGSRVQEQGIAKWFFQSDFLVSRRRRRIMHYWPLNASRFIGSSCHWHWRLHFIWSALAHLVDSIGWIDIDVSSMKSIFFYFSIRNKAEPTGCVLKWRKLWNAGRCVNRSTSLINGNGRLV